MVEVKVTEGPMTFARHAIGFTAWGTAVKLVAEAHQFVQPEVVLPLDDAVVTFEAESLRSAGQGEGEAVSRRQGLGGLGPAPSSRSTGPTSSPRCSPRAAASATR